MFINQNHKANIYRQICMVMLGLLDIVSDLAHTAAGLYVWEAAQFVFYDLHLLCALLRPIGVIFLANSYVRWARALQLKVVCACLWLRETFKCNKRGRRDGGEVTGWNVDDGRRAESGRSVERKRQSTTRVSIEDVELQTVRRRDDETTSPLPTLAPTFILTHTPAPTLPYMDTYAPTSEHIHSPTSTPASTPRPRSADAVENYDYRDTLGHDPAEHTCPRVYACDSSEDIIYRQDVSPSPSSSLPRPPPPSSLAPTSASSSRRRSTPLTQSPSRRSRQSSTRTSEQTPRHGRFTAVCNVLAKLDYLLLRFTTFAALVTLLVLLDLPPQTSSPSPSPASWPSSAGV